jgi:heme exporter protein D
MIPVKSKAEKIPMIFFVTKVSFQIKVLLNSSFHSNRRYKTSLIEMSKKREREKKQQQQQQQSKKNKYTYTYTHKRYIIPLAQRT